MGKDPKECCLFQVKITVSMSSQDLWPVSGSSPLTMQSFLFVILWSKIEKLWVVFNPFLVGWLSLAQVFEPLFYQLFMEEAVVQLLFFRHL